MGVSSRERLGVYRDSMSENSFVIRISGLTFARVNRVGEQWCVWYYTRHLQENFPKLRDALARVEKEYIAFCKAANEIH